MIYKYDVTWAMKTSMQKFISKITSNPKQLFLIDSLGAALTAFSLGVVLTQFESIFRMPRSILYILSLVACSFAIYSFCCYLFVGKNWRPFLTIIAIANLLYCCVTLGLIFYLWEKLTALGVVYFLGEIILIAALVAVEVKAVVKNT